MRHRNATLINDAGVSVPVSESGAPSQTQGIFDPPFGSWFDRKKAFYCLPDSRVSQSAANRVRLLLVAVAIGHLSDAVSS